MTLLETLGRAAYLAGLAIVPSWLSPEPLGSPGGPAAALGALVLLGPTAIAVLLYRHIRSVEAKANLIVAPLTAVALVVAARVYAGPDAPLLRGYYVAAPFVWTSLAVTSATLTGHFLGASFKNRKAFGAVVMLALGIFSFRASHELIGAPAVEQWEAVLRADPANERAIDAIMSDPRERAKYPNMAASLDVCIRRSPSACGCLTNRAFLRLQKSDAKGATDDVRAAEAAQCPRDAGKPPLRIVAARAFSASGETDAAEAELESAKDRESDAALVYVDALIHQQRGDLATAETLARKASEKGAGRDADLLLASLLMSHNATQEARPILQGILREHPKDADATYDLALLADQANDYNAAREGYLRALDLDPHKSDARYNLALLTLRQGVLAESQHHAQRFVESYPDDPRGPQLLKITGANRNSQ